MDRKAFVQAFLDQVWSDGDVDAVDRYVSGRYTIHHDPGDPWNGQTLTIDGFKDRLVKSRAAAPDQVFSVQSLVEEGGRIAVAWLWRGTHLGDLPGLPATGKPITMSGLTIYFFEDGGLSGHWQVADRLGIYQQITAAS
ncbi:MAG: ester cyclase [Hyphomicrobiales bacterium]|nr:ester cyclase [Hyphomicrobiales bacterium]